MKKLAVILLVCIAVGHASTACSAANTGSNHAVPGAPGREPREGDHLARGVVTKINNDLGSVELDHEDIPELMPAMRMEFYVSDKALINDLAVGDKVDFTILYKGGTETITKITKTEK